MADLSNFELSTLPASRVIGKQVFVDHAANPGVNPCPGLWGKCFGDDTFKTLEAMTDALQNQDYLGFMYTTPGMPCTQFYYIVGMLMKPGTNVPDGFVGFDTNEASVAIGYIHGAEPDVYSNAHRMTEEALRARGFKPDYAQHPWFFELYNCPRFTDKKPDGTVILDYYIPVTKA